MFRSGFEDVAKGRDERINPAPQILQIDEDGIAVSIISSSAYDLAIQAEHRDAVYWIVKVWQLDHVVLLVAT